MTVQGIVIVAVLALGVIGGIISAVRKKNPPKQTDAQKDNTSDKNAA